MLVSEPPWDIHVPTRPIAMDRPSMKYSSINQHTGGGFFEKDS
jgi:hypothetical protein